MSFFGFFAGPYHSTVGIRHHIYSLTASLWSTFVQTLICGILIQIGYFVAVMLLVWRSVSKKSVTSKSHVV